MEKFIFINGNDQHQIELSVIQARFEAYLLFKASTSTGRIWLNEYSRGGGQNVTLVMHFLYDKSWMDTVKGDQEEELINELIKVKTRVFNQLFK